VTWAEAHGQSLPGGCQGCTPGCSVMGALPVCTPSLSGLLKGRCQICLGILSTNMLSLRGRWMWHEEVVTPHLPETWTTTGWPLLRPHVMDGLSLG
jgi:hypothetical protein